MRRALARLMILLPVACFGSLTGARADAPMLFRDACMPPTQSADRIVIAGVGDLLFHEPLQRQALTPETDYRRYFAAVAPVLTGADMTYGNLEGPAAHGVVQGGRDWKDPGRTYDGKVYGTAKDALIFNYHPSVVGDLKAAGFTVLSTANNHAADRRALGIDRTIDALTVAGLPYTGTRRRMPGPDGTPSAQLAGSWSTVVAVKGMRVAWLACSFGTNNLPDPAGQVLLCTQHREVVMAELARLAADPTISAVMLTPHWGDEGASKPKPSDRLYARAAIEAGATAVIGTHPHVVQPWEQIETSDGRQGLVIYSTGNFLSNQHTAAQRSGIIALLELTRDAGSDKARLTAAGFVPTWVEKQNEAGHRIVEQLDGGTYLGVPPPGLTPRPKSRRRGTPVAAPQSVDGLVATLKLLPANRVAMANFRDLPRDECPAPEPVPAMPEAPPLVSMVVADAAPPPSSASLTLSRFAGAISFVVAAIPRLPAPIPLNRADPVMRTRRPARPSDVERATHLLSVHDADKTRRFEMVTATRAVTDLCTTEPSSLEPVPVSTPTSLPDQPDAPVPTVAAAAAKPAARPRNKDRGKGKRRRQNRQR